VRGHQLGQLRRGVFIRFSLPTAISPCRFTLMVYG
jgi:hypothetical protein